MALKKCYVCADETAVMDIPASDVDICETAGFVDLETRFKRLEQNGYVAHFFESQFDTIEMRDIFLGEKTEIYADDDEETVAKKLALQEKLKQKYWQSKLADLADDDDRGAASQASGDEGSKPASQRSSADSVQNTDNTNE